LAIWVIISFSTTLFHVANLFDGQMNVTGNFLSDWFIWLRDYHIALEHIFKMREWWC